MKWIALSVLNIYGRLVLIMFLIAALLAILWRFKAKDCIATYDWMCLEMYPERVFFWSKNVKL